MPAPDSVEEVFAADGEAEDTLDCHAGALTDGFLRSDGGGCGGGGGGGVCSGKDIDLAASLLCPAPRDALRANVVENLVQLLLNAASDAARRSAAAGGAVLPALHTSVGGMIGGPYSRPATAAVSPGSAWFPGASVVAD